MHGYRSDKAKLLSKLTLLGLCVHSKRSRFGHRSSQKRAHPLNLSDAKMKREGRKRLQDEKDGKSVVV